MPELDADFEISTNNLEAEYEISEGEHFDCSFEIYASGATFSNIAGSPYDNEALASALNQKADNSTVETLGESISTIETTINSYGDIVDYNATDFATSVQGALADSAIQPNDSISLLSNDVGYITSSDLSNYATLDDLSSKQDIISDLDEIRSDAQDGQTAYNTIQNYGDIVLYNANDFATSAQGSLANTALQPNDNISELNNNAGYITSASLPTVNNSTITFQKNSVTVGDINLNQSNNETINFTVPTQASDINALPDTTTINDLTTTAQQNAINSGANTSNIGQIATNTSNISSLSTTVTNNYNTLDGRITSEVSTLNTAIGTETTNRQNADNNLQSQIDAIVSSSDVFDIVGTYAELQAYDISTVPVNDIIKVLVDSTHSNAATYYRCVESNNVKSWSYIGAEGAYYTKSESDSLFVDKTTTVNGKALSSNITLTASDVGALPSSTVIGNGTLTIQNNSVDVDTFSANATSNKTINIITPTKTSDLTNDSGFIDSSALSTYATQSDLTSGLATKQDTISDLSTIRSNATNGQSAYTTIGSYGDIVTYNASNFATSAQGSKADTALQQGDNISLLNNNSGFITGITSSDVTSALGYTPYNSTNPNGYTSNVGTVTSVNNTQPDANGNVTISVSGGANTDLSNLTATGEAHFQEPLVSGTNIKTINNISLLGSGNIDTSEIFIAEYGVTSFADIQTAYNAGKAVFCQYTVSNTLLFIPLSGKNLNVSSGDVEYSFVCSLNANGDYYCLYLNSSGWFSPISYGVVKTTSTMVSSSRFDGQWVGKYLKITPSARTTGSRTHTLASYLPDATYDYEVWMLIYGEYGNTASYFTVGTVSSPYTNSDTVGNYRMTVAGTTNSRINYCAGVLPIKHTDRNIYSQVTSGTIGEAQIYLYGYRRIGSNT